MTPLEELRDKVAAGIMPFTGGHHPEVFDPDGWQEAKAAFFGYLDGAFSLHKAVLPKGEVDSIMQFKSLCKWKVIIGVGEKHFTGEHELPARAWLLAILAAKIEGE